MTLALIFRPVAHYTTGFAFKRALEYLDVDFDCVDNNDVWAGRVNLGNYDAALLVDDGFALKPRILPNMPSRSAAFLIDLHNEPDAYIPYLHQFGKVYCAQSTYGVKLVEASGQKAEWLPLAYDSLGIPYTEQMREIPITFVASWSTEQRVYLKEIIDYKYRGVAREMFHEELGDTLSASKLGLNTQGGVGHRVFHTHVNTRFFETMGTGALLIQQDLYDPLTKTRIDDMDNLGLRAVQGWHRNVRPSGEHFWDRTNPVGDEGYVTFIHATQMFETIDYYLRPENQEERAEIAARGQAWVMANHTYVHRTKTILDALGVDYRKE